MKKIKNGAEIKIITTEKLKTRVTPALSKDVQIKWISVLCARKLWPAGSCKLPKKCNFSLWNISADSMFSGCCCVIFPQDHQVRRTDTWTNYRLKHPAPPLSTLRRNASPFVSRYNKTVWTRPSSRAPEMEGREGLRGREGNRKRWRDLGKRRREGKWW